MYYTFIDVITSLSTIGINALLSSSSYDDNYRYKITIDNRVLEIKSI